MIIRIKRKTLEQGILSIFVLLAIVSILVGVSFTTNYVTGATNVTNTSVVATLNVTNTEPNITAVVLDDLDDSQADEIDLTLNSVTQVFCNATVFDFNGFQDIDADSVNATIFVTSVGIDGNTDNNHRYINRSCGSCVQGSSSTEAICDCGFAVQYYANATEWTCNISVTDRGGTGQQGKSEYLNFSRNGVDTSTVTQLLALDTPTTIIDYGNLSVTQISAAIERNVTNAGNVDFNLTFRGFGGENDSITNDTVAMICEFGNISFDNHKYAVGLNVSFDTKRNLTNQSVDSNFTLPQRTNDNDNGLREDFNLTFWQLEIPLSVGGLCNGTIVFGAIEAT